MLQIRELDTASLAVASAGTSAGIAADAVVDVHTTYLAAALCLAAASCSAAEAAVAATVPAAASVAAAVAREITQGYRAGRYWLKDESLAGTRQTKAKLVVDSCMWCSNLYPYQSLITHTYIYKEERSGAQYVDMHGDILVSR